MRTDLPLFSQLRKTIVWYDLPTFINQRGHWHEQFDCESIGPHFNQPITVRPASLKPSQTPQSGTVKEKMTELVRKRYPTTANTFRIVAVQV